MNKFRMVTCLQIIVLTLLSLSCNDDDASLPQKEVWIDPAFSGTFFDEDIVVWFDSQFLPDAGSYALRQDQYGGAGRLAMRDEVVAELQTLSNSSFNQIEAELSALETQGLIENVQQHWIINGFSLKLKTNDISGISSLPGVKYIFKKLFLSAGSSAGFGPTTLAALPQMPSLNSPVTWNLEKMGVQRVWNELGHNGTGVLNVVHDFGFRLEIPAVQHSLYQNQSEVPDNGLDDDGNGLIDDYHGFNFDLNSNIINNANDPDDLNHGSVVAAVISGGLASDTLVGMAPGSKWAPIRGIAGFERMVEWSIEQGADTYSMSFSIPDMGEFRTHWRKVIEQGTYCGLFFVSGAGNFGDPANGNFAPVPVQMRNPEDIPEAVFGVAGVDSTFQRPNFSSQGPVDWSTHYYNEGGVDKPDFATFNFGLSYPQTSDGALAKAVNGNSLAGPHMTGIIALMLSANRDLLPWEVRDILKSIAVDLGTPGFDNQSGFGFVNAYDAVSAVK